eukprot:CAMPEP_0114508652 /NCGR_PEP_ID=MMETSP0109-20121206/12737_1 /TAXON_ID=29199 /ORGANISM="Chlorarachnion reptans, Strain CCCM449" /LENGTH=256 /DNA_ID=CAMNT_0001687645 /DNA_START=402 /DNA_END=1172 /DNA_ORIENTATION=-
MPWEFYIVITDLVIVSLALEAFYITYMILTTIFATNLVRTFGFSTETIRSAYRIAAGLFIISHFFSVIMTIIRDDYRWSLIRDVATVLLLLFTAIVNVYLIVQIKILVRAAMENGNWDQISEVLDSQTVVTDDSWERYVDLSTEQILQRKLSRLLCVIIPIALLGTFAICFLTVATQTQNTTYSEMITGAYDKYSVVYDIFGFWYLVLAYVFLVYYAYTPRTRIRSKKTTQNRPSGLSTATGGGSQFAWSSTDAKS